MECEVIGDAGTEWTNSPRDLSANETAYILQASRLEGVRLHRHLTQSTLAAAVRIVDAIQAAR